MVANQLGFEVVCRTVDLCPPLLDRNLAMDLAQKMCVASLVAIRAHGITADDALAFGLPIRMVHAIRVDVQMAARGARLCIAGDGFAAVATGLSIHIAPYWGVARPVCKKRASPVSGSPFSTPNHPASITSGSRTSSRPTVHPS